MVQCVYATVQRVALQRQHCEKRKRRYLSYLEADFEIFRPAAAKNVEFFVCLLSVCLSVTLLNIRVCATDVAMKALEYRNDFDAVG